MKTIKDSIENIPKHNDISRFEPRTSQLADGALYKLPLRDVVDDIKYLKCLKL